MVSSSSSYPFSAHSDVLEAVVPSDRIGQTVLLTELRNRAKAAVSAGQWPDAQRLYEKAIVVCEAASDSQAQESAICHANLSLVLGKMAQWKEAKEAALQATRLDASYAKAYWRLGSACAALRDYQEAWRAFDTVQTLDPSSTKALAKEKERIRQEQQQYEQNQRASSLTTKTSPSATAPRTTPAPPRSELPGASGTTSKTKPTTPSTTTQHDHDDEDVGFSKSEVTRGYKIVNGKKTSYFHNELDEHTKQLIGDIAPKKLDTNNNNNTATTTASSSNTDTIGSAWNQAGTWEEKEISAWASDHLQRALRQATHREGPLAATVTDATVTGSASVAMVRGRKRYIYELSAKVQWRVTESDKDDAALAHGTITFPDIDGTCAIGEPYDATGFAVESMTGSQVDHPTLQRMIHKTGLRDALHKAIDAWVRLLQETY